MTQERERRALKVAFCDFHEGFDPADNFLLRLLEPHFAVELSDDPEVLFFSFFGREHRRYSCKRIYWTGENYWPDYRHCDVALTFDHFAHPRHWRFPLYALSSNGAEDLVRPADFDAEAELARKTGFCSFLFSNGNPPLRNALFDKLSAYKRVDSGGPYRNNMGAVVPRRETHTFFSRYKFTIAFENSEHPGYTTEKLVNAFRARSIGLYWGNPWVGMDFDEASFLSLYRLGSLDALVERVIALDQDDGQYLEMLARPPLIANRPQDFQRLDAAGLYLKRAIDGDFDHTDRPFFGGDVRSRLPRHAVKAAGRLLGRRGYRWHRK